MINYGSDNEIDKVTKKAMINHGDDNKIDKATTVVKQTSTAIYKKLVVWLQLACCHTRCPRYSATHALSDAPLPVTARRG